MKRPVDQGEPALAPLRTALGAELTIQKRRRTRVMELRDADHLYGTLERRSVFGTLAGVAVEGGRFTFKRVGFLRSRATIRREGAEDGYAVLEPRWTGEGRLIMTDGRELHWEREGFWRPTWRIDDAQGVTLFWIRSAGFTGNRGMVTLAPGAARMRDGTLLILFAWYLVQLMSEEAAAAAAS